jgi:uncharacterized membrane protein YfcA
MAATAKLAAMGETPALLFGQFLPPRLVYTTSTLVAVRGGLVAAVAAADRAALEESAGAEVMVPVAITAALGLVTVATAGMEALVVAGVMEVTAEPEGMAGTAVS